MPNYVNVTECAEFLGIDITNTYLDAELDSAILIAESIVDDYLNTSYEFKEDYEYLLSGNGTDTLTLNLPLASVASIVALDTDLTVLETYIADDYRIGPSSPKTGFYRFITKTSGTFPKGVQNIKVTGDFGFADETETHQVFKVAVFYVIKAIFDSKVKGTFTQHERSGEDITIYQAPGELNLVPHLAQHILNNYRYVRENLRI